MELSKLLPLVEDIRDFEFHKVHGEVALANIPDFDVGDGAPIVIDQSSTEDCSGASTSQANTVYSTDMSSLVDYLNKKGQKSDITSRGNLAVQNGLVASIATYAAMAANGTNADVNAQLLAILRYQNGDFMDFLYQFAKICQVMNVVSLNGADLRSAMKSVVTYGSLPKNQSPFTYNEGKATDKTTAFLSDWKNWPAQCDIVASKYKPNSYFAVTGSGDAFDNMISCLWLNKQNKTKSPVVWGLYYKPQWVNPVGGIVVDDGTAPTYNSMGGHALEARGKKTLLANVAFAKVQGSWGKNLADHGIYYFPRSVINEMVAIFGSFTFSNLAPGTALSYLQNGIQLGDGLATKIYKIIISFFQNYASKSTNSK